ncbi:MAG: DUF3373 family protein [Campylobacterota bacterium]|nr:DUF3373 family protein [Campylobacterota bacterium]
MNKPLLISLATASLLFSNVNAASMNDRFQEMEKEMQDLKTDIAKLQKEQLMTDEEHDDESEEDEEGEDDKISELEESISDLEDDIEDLNSRTSGNALKFGVDFRTAVDNLNYKMADGEKEGNDALITNRLWLNMNWKATDNLSFTGQLAYNKAFGNRSGFNGGIAGFETFDWITNENAYDDVLRVRSAFFFYRNDTFIGTDIPWTFSIGRRPSTNGNLINLRDDDKAASPMGHTINVEFDGLSSKFSFAELTGVSGMYVKLCAGRGGTNANAKFFTVDPQTGAPSMTAPYATNDDDIPDIDLVGLIFVPYNDGQYKIGTQYYYASNLIDADMQSCSDSEGNPYPCFKGMDNVGGMHAFTANLKIDGIGDEWSDFLDDTTLFISGAWSMTDPKEGGQGMLGSQDAKTGSSFWIGTQFPSLISEDGRWGLEYNKGDKYWRSITYAEDTNIGSKIAARGSAYEAYITEPLHEDVLSFQLRFTYIDYDYSGSNGFFGSAPGSTPYDISDIKDGMYGPDMAAMTVDTAQDIRAYIRYRF